MGKLRARFARLRFVGVLAAVLLVPQGALLAAPPNALDNPSVSPRSGQTTTTFAFAVHYVGRHPATRVSVTVGSRTLGMTLHSGTATDGTYEASGPLPAGTWAVTFIAVADQANSPSLAAGEVTVRGPASTPRPSRVPAPTATQAPAATPPPGPSAGATISTGGAAPEATRRPQARATASPAKTKAPVAAAGTRSPRKGDPAAATVAPEPGPGPVPGLFWPVMLGGLGLIGLVVAYWLFAASRTGRRRELAAQAVTAAERAALATQPSAESERTPAVWELDARLEEEPIGTVEYLPLENGAAVGTLPDGLDHAPERRSSRRSRLAQARSTGFTEDRRTLLRRS